MNIKYMNLEGMLKTIQQEFNCLEDRIKYLEEKNKKLKDEAYKDNELQEMKKRFDEMQKDLWRGFPITEQEQAAIKAWKKKHDEEVHGVRNDVPSCKRGRSGYYTYHFYPSSIGTCGEVHCSCGAKFVFQEMD